MIDLNRRNVLKLVTGLTITGAQCTLGGDWPQWQGPKSNGISSEPLPRIDQLKIAWKKEIGIGYSGIATSDERIYSMGHDGKRAETLYCLSATDGQEIWRQSYSAPLMPKLHSGGPNATPLIVNDRIYTVSKDGNVHRRSIKDGSIVWQASLPELLGIEVPSWGFASSPQIIEGMLIFSVGKTVGLNPDTGKKIWISDTKGRPSYSTPRAFSVGGKTYLAAMSAEGLSIIAMENGKTLANHPMRARFDMIATTPIAVPGSAGEFFAATSHVAGRFRFDGTTLAEIWTTTKMKNKFSNSKLIDGYLYGIDGGQGSRRTQIVCMNVANGDVAWIQKGTGHGTLVAGDGHLAFLSDDGALIGFEANPKAFVEYGRQKVLDKTCWTEPTLSNGRLFMRNDKGRLLCMSAT